MLAVEAEIVAGIQTGFEIAAAVEQQVQARVEQALRQERMREDVTGAEAMEHLQRRADPNASLLVRKPAAIAVVGTWRDHIDQQETC